MDGNDKVYSRRRRSNIDKNNNEKEVTMEEKQSLTDLLYKWQKDYPSLWSFIAKVPEERKYMNWEKEVRERVQKDIENEKDSSKEKE